MKHDKECSLGLTTIPMTNFQNSADSARYDRQFTKSPSTHEQRSGKNFVTNSHRAMAYKEITNEPSIATFLFISPDRNIKKELIMQA